MSEVIPVAIGVIGTSSKICMGYLTEVAVNMSFETAQKVVILGIAYILRNVL